MDARWIIWTTRSPKRAGVRAAARRFLKKEITSGELYAEAEAAAQTADVARTGTAIYEPEQAPSVKV